jgi:hypothetical protein
MRRTPPTEHQECSTVVGSAPHSPLSGTESPTDLHDQAIGPSGSRSPERLNFHQAMMRGSEHRRFIKARIRARNTIQAALPRALPPAWYTYNTLAIHTSCCSSATLPSSRRSVYPSSQGQQSPRLWCLTARGWVVIRCGSNNGQHIYSQVTIDAKLGDFNNVSCRSWWRRRAAVLTFGPVCFTAPCSCGDPD